MKNVCGPRYYREKLGLSQREMGEMFGISNQAYSKKERGKTRFTADEMKKIKLLVNVHVDKDATIDEIFFSD